MRKYIILLLLFCGLSFFVKIPKYKELNHLKIIDKITINCDGVILREVIPSKDNNGIKYKYKYYKEKKITNKYYTSKAKIINKCKK